MIRRNAAKLSFRKTANERKSALHYPYLFSRAVPISCSSFNWKCSVMSRARAGAREMGTVYSAAVTKKASFAATDQKSDGGSVTPSGVPRISPRF
jgi:hypothetical protein